MRYDEHGAPLPELLDDSEFNMALALIEQECGADIANLFRNRLAAHEKQIEGLAADLERVKTAIAIYEYEAARRGGFDTR